MRLITALPLVLFLFGCTSPLTLLPVGGGESGKGMANSVGKKVEITLNGRLYTGSYVYDGGTTVPTTTYGTTTATVAGRTVTTYGPSYGTAYVPGSGNGRILAASSNGDAIRCEFIYRSGSGLGICSDDAGKQYDLKIE